VSTIQDLAELIENASDYAWLKDAACADLGLDELDQFFVEAGRSLSKDTLQMCGECPVRAECIRHAYENDIAGGYFGGTSPTKRRSVPLAQALEDL